MPTPTAFNAAVATRTSTATTIRYTPELLAIYEGNGGTAEDLDLIISTGRTAEAANLGQSVAAGQGKGATGDVLAAFEAMRTEYKAVMAVVQAVVLDLKRTGAPADVVAAVKQVLLNEIPVRLVETEKDGVKTTKARKVRSFEAIRAEVAKDVGALLATTGAHAALAKRKVTTARLNALKASADALAGKVGEQTVSKGAAKASTAAEKAAVKSQNEVWGGSYRLLAAVGRADARIAALLAQAAAAAK